MAVSAFKSTTRKQYDIRGVEIEDPSGGRLGNRSPSRRRSMSRAPSPTRRATSRQPPPTRRSMSKAPSPTRRRSMSKAPSPTRGRRGVSRNPSPSRRAMSKAPSPTRQSTARAASPVRTRRLSPSRNPSPTRGRRGVSRNPSPTRGRRGVSRGPSPTRGARLTPASPARIQTRPTSPTRGREASVGPRPRVSSPPRGSTARAFGHVHRRSQSTADVALAQFQPDSPVASDSPTIITTRQSGIGLRASSRMLPSDSESEVEPRYARRLDRSGSFSTHRDSSDNESVQSSRSTSRRHPNGLRERISRRTSSTQLEMRRSLTNLEISDTSTPVYYQKPKTAGAEDHHRNVGKIDVDTQVEGRVEEKTIQEVHTQTKVHTLCYNCLYDVSASTDVPADATSPIGPLKLKVAGNSTEAPAPGDVDFVALYNARCAELRRAVSDARNELGNVKEEELRKVIEAKLELSERKVSELWSQFATEEQRCLHLVKSVKDIKEGSVDPVDVEADDIDLKVTVLKKEDLRPQQPHRYSMEDMDESDFIRQSLDEEAARYFEECAIIANFDANVVDVDDISLCSDGVSDGETTVCDDPRPSSRRQSSESQEIVSVRKEIKPLDNEGIALPWLDWEPEVDLGRKERIEKAVCDFREWKSAWARKSVQWGKSSNRERGKDEGVVHVDEFLFERTRLQPRISQGRMLVCGGKR